MSANSYSESASAYSCGPWCASAPCYGRPVGRAVSSAASMVASRSAAVARLSLVVFIAACRRRRQTARRLLPLHTPAPIHCGPSSKRLQLMDPQIDAYLEDSRIARHARSLRRRRHHVTGAPTRTPARTGADHRDRRANLRQIHRTAQHP